MFFYSFVRNSLVDSICWKLFVLECTSSSSAYFHFVTLFLSERQDKVLSAAVQGKDAQDDV